MPAPIECVLERIADNVIAALQNVRTLNGYGHDLIVQEPDAVDGNAIQDQLCVLVKGNPTAESDGVPLNQSQWSQPFEASACRIRPESDVTPIRQLLARLAADVIKSLTQDVHRGGLAIDTIIGTPTFDYASASANSGVVTISFTVVYRTLFNDPFRSAHESYE